MPKMPSYLAAMSVPPNLFSQMTAESGPIVPALRPLNVPGSPNTDAEIVCASPRRNVSLPE